MEDFSSEKIHELRNLIDQRLRTKEIYQEIRKMVQSYLEESNPNDSNSEESAPDYVLQVFRERGIIENLITSLSPKIHPSISQSSQPVPSMNNLLKSYPNGIFLHLKLQGGKAFLEFQKKSPPRSHLVVSIQFRNQRYRSRPVPSLTEPRFDDDFVILLRENDRDITKLLRDDDKIHIVVLESKIEGGYEFVGGQLLEWRKVLKTGLLGFSVEVGGGGCPFPRGVIELRCELIPRPSLKITNNRSKKGNNQPLFLVLDEHLDTQFQLERSRKVEIQREFYIYAQGWYKEYLQTRPSLLRTRLVKIFAETEFGESVPVTSFVTPMKVGRYIDSPAQACRFVSLFPLCDDHIGSAELSGSGSDLMNRTSSLSSTTTTTTTKNGIKDIWWSCHTILSRRSGSVEDHAVLLCNFFLGFGMDAYVCVGGKLSDEELAVRRKYNSRHGDDEEMEGETEDGGRGVMNKNKETLIATVFVLVRRSSTMTSIYDPVSGRRYRYRDQSSGEKRGMRRKMMMNLPFRTMDCVFNDHVFYGNIQRRNDIPNVSLSFENEKYWKSMSMMKLRLVPKVNRPELSLLKSSYDGVELSIHIEKELRKLIDLYRSRLGIGGTEWDGQLSYILSPALYAYEEERRTGNSSKSMLLDFQNCVKKEVRDGHTFRGFPMVVTVKNAENIFHIMKAKKSCVDVLETSGDSVRMGLRVKVFPQPEDLHCIWLFVCSTYRALD